MPASSPWRVSTTKQPPDRDGFSLCLLHHRSRLSQTGEGAAASAGARKIHAPGTDDEELKVETLLRALQDPRRRPDNQYHLLESK